MSLALAVFSVIVVALRLSPHACLARGSKGNIRRSHTSRHSALVRLGASYATMCQRARHAHAEPRMTLEWQALAVCSSGASVSAMP
jgi:hypothetical protein